jgi:hypothetical protein
VRQVLDGDSPLAVDAGRVLATMGAADDDALGLGRRGAFAVSAEQDDLYRGSDRFNLFARR